MLEAILARWRAGLPVGSAAVQRDASWMFKRASTYFGTWGAALEAAGVPVDGARSIGAEFPGLRRVRLARGLTQARLGELADVSPGHVSELERGVYRPTMEVASALAAALKVDLAELLEG